MTSATTISTEAVEAETVWDSGETETDVTGVGVAVAVGVAVVVGVGVTVGVFVGVGVTVGVLVGVDVLVGVGVTVGVLVGVAVLVGVGVTVGVFVGVAVLVGVPVAVAVAVGVAVGDTKVSEPLVVVRVMDPADVLVKVTAERMSGDVPSATVTNWTVESTPVPLAPGLAPVVVQLNVTEVAVVVGAGQFTVRPVEPRNVPLETLVKERTALSQVSVKS